MTYATYQRREAEFETTLDLSNEQDVKVLIEYRIKPARYKDEQDELESFTVTRLDDFSTLVLDREAEAKMIEEIWSNEYD